MKYNLKKNKVSVKQYDYEYTYNEEFDDFSSISGDISDVFSEEEIEFCLTLKNVQLPVDTWGDFPFFLDDFLDYIDFLFTDRNIDFAIALSNQGIETVIYFSKPKKNVILVKEYKFLKSSYFISANELIKDAKFFFKKLILLIEEIIPNMKKNEWFAQWENSIVKLMGTVH